MNTVDNAGQIDHDQLFNATANGVVVTNSDGTILKVNNNARQIFGVKDHTLIGSSAYISLPLIGKVIKESLISKNNIRGYLVSNENISIVLNTTLIWKKEKILGAVASFQEAAVFEKIAKKLEFYQLQNRELNAIFESVSDGIWVCDGDGIVLDINEASATKPDGVVSSIT